MPRGDKTGPQGASPMTGRRMGNCAEEGERGFGYFGRGFGFNRGRGFGYGWKSSIFNRTENPDLSEKTTLENGIRILKDKLSSLEKRLSFFKKEG